MAITPAWLRFRAPLLAIVSLLIGTSASHAELIWDATHGWQVAGTPLDSAAPAELNRDALDHMNRARAAEEAGKTGEAISQYKIVAKSHKSSIYAAEAHFRLGKLWHQRHRYYKAFDSLQVIVEKFPNYAHFDYTIGEQYQIATALINGSRNRIWGVIPSFKNRSQGVEYLETIVKTAPFSDYAPLSLMTIARAEQRAGDSDAAIDALDRMVNNYPQSFLASDAYLDLAKSHASLVQGPRYDQASTQQALTYYQDFLILFPDDLSAPNASAGLDAMRTMLAESKMQMAHFFDHYRSNYVAARVFYNEAITIYPDSAVAARARTRLDQIEPIIAGGEAATQTPRAAPPVAPRAKKRFWLF